MSKALIYGEIPRNTQAEYDHYKHERMGHWKPGIQGVYSHVTGAVGKQVIKVRRHRWIRTRGRESS